MTKRKHHTAFTGHGGIIHTTWGASMHRPWRGMRQHRRTGHFGHSSITSTMDISTQTGEPVNKAHQAHLIPGVDGQTVFGFPKSIITKLRYCDNYSLTSTTGAVARQFMSANGIFDPDITGSGHQPMWRDNYAAIYNNYVVLGSKITVHFQSQTMDRSYVVGIVGDDDSSTSTTLSTLQEQNNSIWTVHGTAHAGPTILTHTYQPLEDIGIAVKDDGYMSVPTGQNPTQQWYYCIFLAALPSSDTGVVNVTVEVEYTVKFQELISQVQN
jgi:hypothetical protein